MNLNKDRLYYLLKQYIADTISEEELIELSIYVNDTAMHGGLHDLIDELWAGVDMERPLALEGDVLYEKIIADGRVQKDLPKQVEGVKAPWGIPLIKWYRLAGIAALFCMAIGLFWYVDTRKDASVAHVKPHHKRNYAHILPGGNKAMLMLADGRVISLDEVKAGNLAEEDGMRIIKTAEGKLLYEDGGTQFVKSAALNTINTPMGGEYQLTLPDGTKVWLNAASSLRFPVRFTGDVRNVELIGEAYFEVNNDPSVMGKRVPFVVKTASQKVEVLGTHFNIKAYPNEDVAKTTLVEGSVRVSVQTDDGFLPPAYNILKPNQQATSKWGRNRIEIATVDPINAVAWKNGYFSFHDDNITDVMKTISRWYNIDVEYKGKTVDKIFGGTISRFETFEKLLQTIELTGTVKFRIQGRRVIVIT